MMTHPEFPRTQLRARHTATPPSGSPCITFPLMTAVQLMCARLGIVTGRGLAASVRMYYPRWVLWGACLILAVANIINIGADLGGMAEATQLVTGVHMLVWIPIYAVLIVVLMFWASYKLMAEIFKWMTLVLFAYVFASFYAHVDWRRALMVTLVPHLEFSRGFLSVLVAILGTTISPYLFFWQAAEEVEEKREKIEEHAPKKSVGYQLKCARTDTLSGMLFSNLIMYFIILTTAATLHAHGKTDITTAREAAEALRPLAGNGAYLLFTLGLIGTGMLGVPVLVGSCAYAISEAAGWRASVADKPYQARKFYAVMAVAMTLGLALELPRLERRKDALLLRGNERPARPAPDPSRDSSNQQPQGNGSTHQLATAKISRLGDVRDHDSRRGRAC